MLVVAVLAGCLGGLFMFYDLLTVCARLFMG